MRLRVQLALLVTTAIVGSLGAAMYFTTSLTRAQLEEDARASAIGTAEEIARDLAHVPPQTDEAVERRLEQVLRKHRRLTEVELELEEGEQSVSSYNLKSRAEALVKGRADKLKKTGPRTISATMGEGDARSIEVSVPLTGRLAPGRLNVTLSLESVDRLTDTQQNIAYTVALVAILLALGFAVIVADLVVGRPLARLSATMAAVTEGQLQRRVEAEGPTEVLELTLAFNRMLDRLQEADTEIRTFNDRLATEVKGATLSLSEKNEALEQLNHLFVRAREDLADKGRLAALGQLAAQLAHEIGTPLGSVSGHLQLAVAAPDCPPQVRDRLAIASQEIARVGRIIRDYLDATRRMDPDIGDVDVERVVREAVDVARGGHPTRDAPVGVEADATAKSWRTDEGLVRQILVNLVANALDAVHREGGEPGSIQVRAGVETSHRSGRPMRDLVLRVQDNGPGIAPEALARMFEPFYTTKGRGKGTGLGLAICRELTNGLGGRIDVASEPGRGTTFTVRLPDGDELVRRAQAAAEVKQTATVH